MNEVSSVNLRNIDIELLIIFGLPAAFEAGDGVGQLLVLAAVNVVEGAAGEGLIDAHSVLIHQAIDQIIKAGFIHGVFRGGLERALDSLIAIKVLGRNPVGQTYGGG